MRDAKRAWEREHDADLTYREIGEQVAERVGRDRPFSHQGVRKWFEAGQEPESFAVAHALAKVLEVEVSALMFGPDHPDTASSNGRVPEAEQGDEMDEEAERAATQTRVAKKARRGA